VFAGLEDHPVSPDETSQFLRQYSEQREVEVSEGATGRLAEFSDRV